MRRIAPFLALLLVLAACGGGAATTTTRVTQPAGSNDGYPVTVTAANGEVTIDEPPGRIISLAPTATEILFAIGAGSQVVAVDEFSNYPEEAPTTDLSGYEPNVEAIAELDPDLVVVSDDFNDIVAGLTALAVPVVHLPAAVSLDDTYAQIGELGSATGHSAEATALVSSMRDEIETLAGSAPEFDEPLTYYHELDDFYFTVTSETFIGEVYGLAGLENIADEADGAETLYPQLSAEYIIEADPDLIFLADTKCCGQSPATVRARPGWDQLTAVTTGSVVALDDDIASRWGPRVIELLRAAVDAMTKLGSAG